MPYRDPARAQTYNREYKRANRWRYRARQKSFDAARHANERAAKYGRPGVLTPEDVEAVLAAEECRYCGTTEDLGIDHVVGLHDPAGTNYPENIVACCHSCNAKKRRRAAP